MRGGLTCLLLVWFVLSGSAQYQFVKQWDYRYGGSESDECYSLQVTSDKGFILSGSSHSGISGDKTEGNWDTTLAKGDMWVVKLDSNGLKQWDKRFGGTGQDYAMNIIELKNRGYAIGGQTASGQSGNKSEPSRGSFDYWIVQTDASGNKVLDKRFGGWGDDGLYGMKQTIDNGFILGGYSESPVSGDKTEPNLGPRDFWLVKIDSLGSKQWDKRYGGDDVDRLDALELSRDGGYLLGGRSNSDSSGDKTQHNWGAGYDIWLIKVNSTGQKEWDKRLGTPGYADEIWAIEQTNDNGYILGCNSTSDIEGDKTDLGYGAVDYWIIKIDSVGNKQWDRDFGGEDQERIWDIRLTQDGGYLAAGESHSDKSGDKSEDNIGYWQSWIVKIDSAGDKQWDKTVLTPASVYSTKAIEIDSSCYVVSSAAGSEVGGDKSQVGWGNRDFWVIKYCWEPYNSVDHGQQTTDNSQLQVWPNPFNTDLSLTLSEGERIVPTATFTITTVTGQVVYQQQEANLARGYTKMLDLSYLPNGVYFVEVSTAAGKAVKRVVKE